MVENKSKKHTPPAEAKDQRSKVQVKSGKEDSSLRASARQSGEKQDSTHSTGAQGKLAPLNDKKRVVKGSLSVPVYSLAGKLSGNLDLPKEIFGVKVNQNLLLQAMRVYLNNQKAHFSNTKTRGEVKGSTRKIWQQKGTGRARHGAITAPIFVGGGVALGPKYRKIELDLPKKMRKAALISSLSQKAAEAQVLAVAGLDKAAGKTKEMTGLISKIKDQRSKNLLIVGDKNYDNVLRAVRNIKGVDFMSADQVNAFEIIKHQSLILTREAVEKLQERFAKKSMKETPGPVKKEAKK